MQCRMSELYESACIQSESRRLEIKHLDEVAEGRLRQLSAEREACLKCDEHHKEEVEELRQEIADLARIIEMVKLAGVIVSPWREDITCVGDKKPKSLLIRIDVCVPELALARQRIESLEREIARKG